MQFPVHHRAAVIRRPCRPDRCVDDGAESTRSASCPRDPYVRPARVADLLELVAADLVPKIIRPGAAGCLHGMPGCHDVHAPTWWTDGSGPGRRLPGAARGTATVPARVVADPDRSRARDLALG